MRGFGVLTQIRSAVGHPEDRRADKGGVESWCSAGSSSRPAAESPKDEAVSVGPTSELLNYTLLADKDRIRKHKRTVFPNTIAAALPT